MVIEFKVRKNNDLRNWEDIPVYHTAVAIVQIGKCVNTQKVVKGVCAMIQDQVTCFEEIRWNYEGSKQGHYL